MNRKQAKEILAKIDAMDLSGIDTIEKELDFIFSFFPNSAYRVFNAAGQGIIHGYHFDECVYGYAIGPNNIFYKSCIVERIRWRMNPDNPYAQTRLEHYVSGVRPGHTHENDNRVETLYLQALEYMQQHEGEPGAENYDTSRNIFHREV